MSVTELTKAVIMARGLGTRMRKAEQAASMLSEELSQIHEKPDESTRAHLPRPWMISMNCWRLGPAIFEACHAVPRSVRGEYELTDAVRWCIKEMGITCAVACTSCGVLDLSCQSDIAAVANLLQHREVIL